jgi:4a-hydroxytetrahydrobiopterin dehydratase
VPEWKVFDGPASAEVSAGKKKIIREFKFGDFKAAMGFVNEVAAVAEAEGHHPDIYIFYNLVRLELSTHAIGGLSENDFIMAAKIGENMDPSTSSG